MKSEWFQRCQSCFWFYSFFASITSVWSKWMNENLNDQNIWWRNIAVWSESKNVTIWEVLKKPGISFQFYFPILGLFTLRLNRAHQARPLPKICQILQDVPKTFSSSAIFLNTKCILCPIAEWLEKMGQFCNVLFINIWTQFHPLPAADNFLQSENSHLILMMIMVVV